MVTSRFQFSGPPAAQSTRAPTAPNWRAPHSAARRMVVLPTRMVVVERQLSPCVNRLARAILGHPLRVSLREGREVRRAVRDQVEHEPYAFFPTVTGELLELVGRAVEPTDLEVIEGRVQVPLRIFAVFPDRQQPEQVDVQFLQRGDVARERPEAAVSAEPEFRRPAGMTAIQDHAPQARQAIRGRLQADGSIHGLDTRQRGVARAVGEPEELAAQRHRLRPEPNAQ